MLRGILSLQTLREDPIQALWIAAAAVLFVAVLRGFCSYGQRIYLSRGSERFVKGIRDDLYRHIQHLTYAWHTAHPTGEIIQRCTSDVDVIRNFVCNQLVEVVRTVFLIILYLSIMFSMNIKLSLVAVAFIPHRGPVLRGILSKNFLTLSDSRRSRGRTHHLRARKSHRSSRGPGIRPGAL